MYIAIAQQGGAGGPFVIGQYPTPRECLEAAAEAEPHLVPPFKIRVRAVGWPDHSCGEDNNDYGEPN